MASVFLSYVHEDSDKARPIARTLERAGHQVWWDRFIKGGAEYSDEIEAELGKADFVVVLWSERSIHSTWVRDEAAAGRDSARLVPVRLDGAEPPMGFRQFQTIDLSGWKGHGEARLRPLLDALHLSAAAPVSVVSGSGLTGPWKPSRRFFLSVAVMAAILIAGILTWKAILPASSVPLVAIHAAEPSDQARGYARGLLVKLGSLQSSKTDKLRLIGSNEAETKVDLIFEVGASGQGEQAAANLVLLAGKDRSVLWSKDFQQEGGNLANLEQGMAYTAAQVLGCALEEAGQKDSRLDLQTLKLFLNGCALFGERYRADPRSVAPIFSQVIAKAPRFQPAWSRLLLAEAQMARAQMLFFERSAPGPLPQHIQEARKLNPRLPELFVAEGALLPLTAFAERMRLADEAVRLNPDNPHLWVIRSEFVSFVGRMGESVDDARRVVELDPLSPGFRGNLIQILAYAGRMPAAWEELRRAEQLWPASPAIEDSRFRLYSRYGDAGEALRMLQSASVRQFYMTQDLEPYLLARIDPAPANVQRAIAATRNPALPETRQMVSLVQLLGEFRQEDELYRVLLHWGRNDQLGAISAVLFRPPLRRFRQDPRFMQIAARAGLVKFWRQSGKWPDFCSEPDLPYDCKVEAAKIAP